jgi:hypothetical protein
MSAAVWRDQIGGIRSPYSKYYFLEHFRVLDMTTKVLKIPIQNMQIALEQTVQCAIHVGACEVGIGNQKHRKSEQASSAGPEDI